MTEPTKKQVLLNPGPTNVSDAVRAAMAGPDWCHREPEYFDLQDETRALLLSCFGLDPARWTNVLLTGSGTAAVETMVGSAVPRGKKLLVLDNGVYGDRIAKMCAANGTATVSVRADWFARPSLEEVERVLSDDREIATVAVVHHETTTGLLNDVPAVGAIAKRHGKRVLVDAVSSLAGESLDIDASGADYLACTANKCVQGMPGIAFVLARREAVAEIAPGTARSLYLDLKNLAAKQDARDTPFTPAIQVLFALRQALRELATETLPKRVARYAGYARIVRGGLERLGLPVLVEPALRSNTITTIGLPKGKTYDDVHDAYKAEGFVIYAGQGDLRSRAFRISTMGNLENATVERAMDVLARLVG
ncbi:MAG: 2-aminoethylphosphonate aminotransferase [Deltaproteobacteria bacterium]|nr:2-aminoethylphosphonate aminotransferase [Deltaproteobacteria bacterium]